jgi:hypothetical protein
MIYKLLLLAFLLSILSCRISAKAKAKLAAKDFCNCIKNNLFSYDTAAYLYEHCGRELARKYELLDLHLKLMNDKIKRDSLPLKTNSDIDTFYRYFGVYAGSCLSLPVIPERQF